MLEIINAQYQFNPRTRISTPGNWRKPKACMGFLALCLDAQPHSQSGLRYSGCPRTWPDLLRLLVADPAAARCYPSAAKPGFMTIALIEVVAAFYNHGA